MYLWNGGQVLKDCHGSIWMDPDSSRLCFSQARKSAFVCDKSKTRGKCLVPDIILPFT